MALAHIGNRVVVQRNVHSSVIDGLVLSGMRPTFVAPELDPELGIAHGLTPDSLAAALDETPEAVAAMVVSPTYFGACADVAGLAEVAHSRGVPLVVDEAWGAHLHFHPDLPTDALASGADLVTSSTHKIVGSLTQAAMLHLGRGGRIDDGDRRPLRQPGRDDQPQRPAHRLARRGPAAGLRPRRGAARRDAGGDRARPASGSARSPASTCSTSGMVGRPGVAGWDPLRLGIDVRGTGSSAQRLWKAAFHVARDRPRALLGQRRRRDLRRRRAAPRRRASGWSRALREAVAELEETPGAPDEKLAPAPPWGELVLTPREAFLGPQEVVPFDAAAGRDRRRGPRRLPAGDPQRPPRRAADRRDARLHPRKRRPRRLRPRRLATAS